jgi:PAS domain S-box-containing protein
MPLRSDLRMRRKLASAVLVIGGTALLLTSVALLGRQWALSRKAILQEATSQGDLIEAECARALAFNDVRAARQILAQLRSGREITLGEILTTNGLPFAAYVRTNAYFVPLPFTRLLPGHRFESGSLLVYRPLLFQGRVMGTLFLHAEAGEQFGYLESGVIIAMAVLLTALLIGSLVSQRLHRIFSSPILDLAEIVQTVIAKEDYSLRAPRQNDGDIGTLTDGLNQMLTQIQRRNEEVRASEQRFRQLAESIGAVFWMTDANKGQMIYISHGYEEIWGQSCASLYASTRGWYDSIHPEDRERMLEVALSRQKSGDYDEEYRIIRPDGALRWIRDRAFPVRNEAGEVYRIAGIAEDITERKRLEREVLEISDREQCRLGQDLHDGICQQLVSIAFATDLLRRDLVAKLPGEAVRAAKITALLDSVITQARNLSHALYPVNLAGDGLGVALRGLAGSISQGQGSEVACEAECAETVYIRDHAVATHLYRIAQEAVQNAIKHAEPTRIVIRLYQEGETIHLSVIDNGLGIHEDGERRLGMGLYIMKYRMSMTGGRLEIRSGTFGGTIVSCVFQQKKTKLARQPSDVQMEGVEP